VKKKDSEGQLLGWDNSEKRKELDAEGSGEELGNFYARNLSGM
jgi:hypothetical protein